MTSIQELHHDTQDANFEQA